MGRLHFLEALFPLLALTRTGIWAFQIRNAITRTAGTSPSTSKLFSAEAFQQQAYRIDVSPRAPRNYNGFFEWAGQHGVIPENFQLNALESDNWGASAAQAAPAGSRVLYVPAFLKLTSKSAREQDFADIAPAVAQSIDPTTSSGDVNLQHHFFLFLKILQEYDLGSQSPYFAWMDALPRKFSTALEFDDFEMDCLPPFVKYLARRDRYNYDLFLKVLQQNFTPTVSDATKSNSQLTKWAFNVVFTRAREVFGEAEIIPMSDMMNHGWNANALVQHDNEGNVHVVLARDVQPGENLLKCYGQPTNPSRFLATYGFFDASPPATYCKLYPGLIVTPELKNLGFDDERLVFHVENGGIPDEVWDVMLYIQLENVDPGVQRQFYEAHMSGDTQTKQQIHQHYFQLTANGLMQHLDDVLREVEECMDEMDEGGMGLNHENLPMIRRHNDFVRQTFSKVRKNLQQMTGN